MKKLLLLLLAFACCSLYGALPTDEEWAALREAAVAYPRIIIDDDGCDMTEVPKSLPCTREAIYAQMLDYTKGTEVDTISFCPFSVGHRLATRSLVTDVHVADAALDKNKNLTAELLAMGTDTMQLAVEFCRANNFKVLANFRVNDIHDSWYGKWMYGIKLEHPEQLCGTAKKIPPFGAWTSFDFGLPEVRARVRAICEELLSHYDVDGLELDFNRFPCFFKSAAWGRPVSAEEIEAMTQLIRDIRADADRIGKIRRRYLIIVARMPDSAKVAMSIGLDIETWFREKLVDIYVPGGDNGYYNTYRDAVALAHRYGVRAFPSVDTSWLGGDRNTIPCFTAQSSAALAAGADGIFYFNMFYMTNYIPKMRRDLRDLRFERKFYFGYYQRLGSFFTPTADSNDLDELGWRRGLGMMVKAGGSNAMEMEVGDDFSDPEVIANNPDVTLTVKTNTATQLGFTTSINGVKQENVVFKEGVYTYTVEPQVINRGANRFDFDLSSDVDTLDHVIMRGDKLLKGSIQPPWRRLFPAHDFANAEEIVDGSYRLRDSGTGEGECENLLYPLGQDVDDLKVSFDLMVEKATAEEAVVFRIANGTFAEMVTFGLDKVVFKFSGVSVPFMTSGEFHHYDAILDDGRLVLFADGKELLAAQLTMKANDMAGFMQGNNLTIPNMNERSLVFGSLSQKGIGVSRWKNVTMKLAGMEIKDVELEVKFRGKLDEAIAKAIAGKAVADRVVFDAAAGGALSAVTKYGFGAGTEKIAEGVAVFSSSAAMGGNQYPAYNLDKADELVAKEGVLIVEWEMAPGETLDDMPHCFQMVLQPADPRGGCYLLPFKFSAKALRLAWQGEEIPLKPGFNRYRAFLNLANGAAAIQINDELVGFGAVMEAGKTPLLFFGDASGYIAGSAQLKKVAIGLVK